ncbi:MAG: helix-turn-helix transcriptional regulator, partial [Spirochaetes bacterium]|nr:helix-turn-helix transcriptional regulator [Spirochaetota bacterium]
MYLKQDFILLFLYFTLAIKFIVSIYYILILFSICQEKNEKIMKILKILRNSFNHTQKKLAKKLSLETNTIALYEAGKANPSFKILKKLIELYQVSYDYFLLDDNCLFPKNLKLLRLAKKLDDLSKSDARNTIESNAKSLLGKKINNKILLRIDLIDLELSTKCNSNLKLIRQYKKLSQEQL